MEDDMIHTSIPVRRFLHGLCDYCRRGIPVGSHLKALHGQKICPQGAPSAAWGQAIVLEKYYNKGAALNFMVKRPNLLRIIHTVILVVVGIFS